MQESHQIPPLRTAGGYMGSRYPKVPDSWEDMPKDSSSETALAMLVSTQVGEAMVEVATGTLEATPVQPPVSVTVTSQSPAKRTKSTVSFRQTTLESFLPILGNTPSLEKRLILLTPPPSNPSYKKNNAVNLYAQPSRSPLQNYVPLPEPSVRKPDTHPLMPRQHHHQVARLPQRTPLCLQQSPTLRT